MSTQSDYKTIGHFGHGENVWKKPIRTCKPEDVFSTPVKKDCNFFFLNKDEINLNDLTLLNVNMKVVQQINHTERQRLCIMKGTKNNMSRYQMNNLD